MMDFFGSWISVQDEMLKFQQAQIDAAKRAVDAGQDMVAAQKAVQDAAQANIKATRSWFAVWGWK